MSEKGYAGLLTFYIFLLIIIPLGLFGYSFLFMPKKENTPKVSQKIVPTPTSIPKNSGIKPDLNNFPIYPSSQLVTSEKSPPCIGQESGLGACGSFTYMWESKDDYDKIKKFYSEDISKSGWKCGGGAGSYANKRDAFDSSICTKLDLSYALNLTATAGATTITVILPDNSSETPIISEEKISPNSRYNIGEESVGDSQYIMIKDTKDGVIAQDIISKNYDVIGYGVKFDCQCRTMFKGWTDPSHFAIKVVNNAGQEYEYIVDAATGIVNPNTYKRIQ